MVCVKVGVEHTDFILRFGIIRKALKRIEEDACVTANITERKNRDDGIHGSKNHTTLTNKLVFRQTKLNTRRCLNSRNRIILSFSSSVSVGHPVGSESLYLSR